MNTMESKTAMLHGRAVSYIEAGAGPVLLLIHGMAGTSENWQAVIEPLARHHTVIAPDLPGHGASAPGAGDYSLGALAAGLRDLLVTLGHETRDARRALARRRDRDAVRLPVPRDRRAPGAGLQRRSRSGGQPGPTRRGAARARPVHRRDRRARRGPREPRSRRGLAAVGLRPPADIAEVARGYASLADPRPPDRLPCHAALGRRRRRSARRRRRPALPRRGHPRPHHLGCARPDHPGPPRQRAHEAIPGSRLEILDGVGHLPQLEAPERFVAVLERFVQETEPAQFDAEQWRARFHPTAEEP